MSNILYFRNQEEFIEWLEMNHQTTTEIWLGFFKKKAKKEGLTWSESVDCALMFGWIDGIRKTVDEDSYKIRFTPRKANSVWSKVNIQKVEKLIELNQMKPEGLTVFNQRKDQTGYSAVSRNVELSKEYEALIRQNSSAWEFFNQLPASYKRDSIWWVMTAKREETQLRRLNRLIDAWENGEMLRP
ncbi:YdeI/OmpD-associated family protein [Vagococcus hydrophili]|uniref:Bacteriocin-protection protein n=1 Tax=Vagococcus hydrophili TaxID=2714947 RepID=A0A6G8ATX2_9ENTE|nr:YdeI/OmpD-associated family protein [Vagococcus hydrophili]QIL48531.1 bacteriocin-protection protein [Vagococcus hydrophili]